MGSFPERYYLITKKNRTATLRPSSDAVLVHMICIEFNKLSLCEVQRLYQFETAY